MGLKVFKMYLLQCLAALPRVQVDGYNKSVETQDLGENEDEDHTNKQSGLLSRSSYSGISDDSDSVPSGQSGQTNG